MPSHRVSSRCRQLLVPSLALLLNVTNTGAEPFPVLVSDDLNIAIAQRQSLIRIDKHLIRTDSSGTFDVKGLSSPSSIAVWGNCTDPPPAALQLVVDLGQLKPGMCVLSGIQFTVQSSDFWLSNVVLQVGTSDGSDFTSSAIDAKRSNIWLVDVILQGYNLYAVHGIDSNVTTIDSVLDINGRASSRQSFQFESGVDPRKDILVVSGSMLGAVKSYLPDLYSDYDDLPVQSQVVTVSNSTFPEESRKSSCWGVIANYAGEGSGQLQVFKDDVAPICNSGVAVSAGAVAEVRWDDVKPPESVNAWLETLVQAGVAGASEGINNPLKLSIPQPSPPLDPSVEPALLSSPPIALSTSNRDDQQASSKKGFSRLALGAAGGAFALIVLVLLGISYRLRSARKSPQKGQTELALPISSSGMTHQHHSNQVGYAGSHELTGEQDSVQEDDKDVPKGLNLFASSFEHASTMAALEELSCPRGDSIVEQALTYLQEHNGGLLDGKYIIDRHVQGKSGGQATVAMAQHRRNNHLLAIKFFENHAVYLQEQAVYMALFQVHPVWGWLVDDMRDHGEEQLREGLPMPSYIVMLRGVSMQDWIRSSRPPPLTGVWILAEICSQVKALHGLGLVHRDLKPANILWMQELNSWCIIDFGCTVKEGESAVNAYTLRYAAPEVIMAGKNTHITPHRSIDIWALGVMALEMLSGELIYPTGTSEEEILLLLSGQRRFMHEEDPSVWSKLGKLRGVVQRMLSRDPSKRPLISEVSAKLDGLFESKGLTTTHTLSRALPARPVDTRTR